MSDLQEVITAAVVGVAIVVLLIWQQWRLNHARQDAARLARIAYEAQRKWSVASSELYSRQSKKQARDSKGRFIKAEK